MSNTRTAPGIKLGRCNPYGAETGGPKRVLGGMYGPGSAATPGRDLPLSVEQGEWPCTRQAVVRCRMTCQCGHKGHIMELCSWHDEYTYKGEPVAGSFRQVRETVRVRGHYEEIQRRQSETCPKCMLPTVHGQDYAQLYREFMSWGNELAMLNEAGMWRSDRAVMIRSLLEDITRTFDEGIARGIIHRCKLTLIPVS